MAPNRFKKNEMQAKKISDAKKEIGKIQKKTIAKSGKGKFPPRDSTIVNNHVNHYAKWTQKPKELIFADLSKED